MDRLAQLLDQLVHALAAEIVQRKTAAVLGVCLGVIKFGGGVEVIVQVDAVHRVGLDDLPGARHDQLPHLGEAGVEIQVALAQAHKGRVLPGRVPLGQLVQAGLQRTGAVLGHPVGVDPGVHLHLAGVGLLHQIGQRVKSAVGRLALLAGQVHAVGEDLGGIEGVGTGPHLKEDGVEAGGLRRVQHLVQLLLQGGLVQPLGRRVIQVEHSGYPNAPHLGLHGPAMGGQQCQQQGCQGEKTFPMFSHVLCSFAA